MAKKKSPKNLDLTVLKNQYKEETGKNAVYCVESLQKHFKNGENNIKFKIK
ncbi:hypothetical protein LCGC14_0709230 [marine sediment metagenome]|uniref:Uncharacterized protein n=1 Tax=marine sediment metagenome TaxID=412755 RepID=A0A0F9QFK6_9ZZZZ